MTYAKSSLALSLLILFPVMVAANSFTILGDPGDEGPIEPIERVSTVDTEIEAMHPALLNLISEMEPFQKEASFCPNTMCSASWDSCRFQLGFRCAFHPSGDCLDGPCGGGDGTEPIISPNY